jgi:carbon-monoxide dehydrogenase small subunit
MTVHTVQLRINGEVTTVDVKAHWSLAYVIREKVGLTGTKTGLDERPIFSCLRMAVDAEGHEIQTIEGVEGENGGELHPLQKSFIELHGMQCGFCTPGMILAAKALLETNPDPSEREVREAIGGHLCRCGTYVRIVRSILDAAQAVRAS